MAAANDPTVRFGVGAAGARPLPSTRLSTFGPRYEPAGGGGGSLVSARKLSRIARPCDAHRRTHTTADDGCTSLFSCARVLSAAGSGFLARGRSPVRAAARPSLAGPGVRNQSWLPAIAPPPPPSTSPWHLWPPDFFSAASCPATEHWIRARRGSPNHCVAHGLAVAVSDSILSLVQLLTFTAQQGLRRRTTRWRAWPQHARRESLPPLPGSEPGLRDVSPREGEGQQRERVVAPVITYLVSKVHWPTMQRQHQ